MEKNNLDKASNIIVIWYDPSMGSLEEHIPLLWNGKRNSRLGSNNDLTLVFLDGISSLEKSYLDELQDVGYQLVDASKIYDTLDVKYKNLDIFGDYEKHCFLRWLVLAELFPSQPLIHYDGDIVCNISPEKISKMVKGKTFVLDGCPAFTVISESKWLSIYQQELNKLVKNPAEYGLDWKGTKYRKNIGSDQDLIDYLVQKKLLPQDPLPTSRYSFVENPLTIIHSKPSNLAFWHMQTDYIHYLNLRYMLAPYGLSSLAPNPLTTSPILLKFIYLLGRIAGRGYLSRLQIYQYVFD